MALHCTECGFVNGEGANYCQRCGALLPRAEGTGEPSTATYRIGETGVQTTRVGMLEKLLPYLRDPANGFWTAPMGAVAHAIRRVRAGKEERP